jgi:SAM-dependent methyltransferase
VSRAVRVPRRSSALRGAAERLFGAASAEMPLCQAFLHQRRAILNDVPLDPLAERGFGSSLGSALVYERGRPAYPSDVARALAAEFGLDATSRVLDLAAGTGQLSRLFVGLVGSVVAVEPSAPMRALLGRRLPRVEVLDGHAERLPLADRSVDAAVIGNAFHWFDGDRAVRELARVLPPGGGLAVLWNIGLETDPPWPRRLERLVEDLRARAVPAARSCLSGTWRRPLDRADDLFDPLLFSETAHERALDHEALVSYIASLSFIAAMGDQERDAVLAEVRALAPEACVLKMRTECYATRRRRGRPGVAKRRYSVSIAAVPASPSGQTPKPAR